MSKLRFLKLCLLGTGLLLTLFVGAPAQQRLGVKKQPLPAPAEGLGQVGEGVGSSTTPKPSTKETKPLKTDANETIIEFPTHAAMRTAWKVSWMTTNGFGLVIRGAWFKTPGCARVLTSPSPAAAPAGDPCAVRARARASSTRAPSRAR